MISSQISVYILALNIEHNHRLNLTKAPVAWAGFSGGVIHLPLPPSTSTVVAKCDIVTWKILDRAFGKTSS